MENSYHIEWEPIGIRSEIKPGQTILSAAQDAGLSLTAFCGGKGSCKACRIVIRTGLTDPVSSLEKETFSETELAQGMRLACCTRAESDLCIDLPVSSLLTSQRLQLEGQDISPKTGETPNIRKFHLSIVPPDLDDLRSDSQRITDALMEQYRLQVKFRPGVYHTISDVIRKNKWNADVLIQDDEIIAIMPPGQKAYGLAVDIGTTKIAAYLIDLDGQVCVGKGGRMNPQISYGEDVVSRIAFTAERPDGRDLLQKVLADTLNDLIAGLCRTNGIESDQIVDIVAVCNTAIHHFFVNLPVAQLGLKPYVPAVSEPLHLSARSLGLTAAPGAFVYLPKNIAGYVGADHVAMLIGSNAPGTGSNRVALDIGTNTEISLITKNGEMFCCSCASGPAFEGAHIKNGMRAADGAIEKAKFIGTELQYRTINDRPPIGICGSGILDLIAELKKNGVVDGRGRFSLNFPGVVKNGAQSEYVITPNISVTRSDINEIILAKSAIRTGLEVLLMTAGLTDDDIDEFIIAGAFGTYLDVANAVEIGMFPDIPPERFFQVGNAAGTGAQKMLLSRTIREKSEKLGTHYVELASAPDFMKMLVGSMNLVRGKC